jgi:hypothetical protein
MSSHSLLVAQLPVCLLGSLFLGVRGGPVVIAIPSENAGCCHAGLRCIPVQYDRLADHPRFRAEGKSRDRQWPSRCIGAAVQSSRSLDFTQHLQHWRSRQRRPDTLPVARTSCQKFDSRGCFCHRVLVSVLVARRLPNPVRFGAFFLARVYRTSLSSDLDKSPMPNGFIRLEVLVSQGFAARYLRVYGVCMQNRVLLQLDPTPMRLMAHLRYTSYLHG